MKLLLTSEGLCNSKIRKELVRLVGKRPKEIKILAVSLKLTKAKITKHIIRLKKEFRKSGIINYTITHLYEKYSYNDIQDYDVIYMCGGNSYYYLDMIRKTNFDKLIKKFVTSDKVYLGASAGAVLACPDIEIVSWSKYVRDENTLNLQNLKALNFIDYLIMPHYDANVAKEISSFQKKSKYKIITIKNSEAVVFSSRNKYYKI